MIPKKMEKIADEIKVCKRCELHKQRINPVPGEGPSDVAIMFCGEAPGYNESVQGKPFVGAAGKKLKELLQIAGLKRGEVFIGNVLKCRPPGNRDPTDEEIEACSPYLREQIALIKPKLIVALGRIAARTLLGRYVSMGREHGTLNDCPYAGVNFKLFVTYHPAAAIYGAETKRRLESDFKKLGQILKK